MTTNTDIVNRALQTIGTRTDVTDGELAGNTTNEAKQANLILANIGMTCFALRLGTARSRRRI